VENIVKVTSGLCTRAGLCRLSYHSVISTGIAHLIHSTLDIDLVERGLLRTSVVDHCGEHFAGILVLNVALSVRSDPRGRMAESKGNASRLGAACLCEVLGVWG
jgi:hypothetical protein